MGAGLRCGSVMCAMVKLIQKAPRARPAKAKGLEPLTGRQ
jgi:hypothetical protein